ncbi:hypothetical protein BJ508DRAFT_334551 [Ascobolus immersus RN42]|uniref:Uncharacterized protein n=1 Tax=Ascobolus immersus RN42 TaxID=1160509 RepID=A0A3N4HFP1_ASCIM|nr:hypothetical protein BJ508DRAFT_334551 [Ascobolus immersus RN42]
MLDIEKGEAYLSLFRQLKTAKTEAILQTKGETTSDLKPNTDDDFKQWVSGVFEEEEEPLAETPNTNAIAQSLHNNSFDVEPSTGHHVSTPNDQYRYEDQPPELQGQILGRTRPSNMPANNESYSDASVASPATDPPSCAFRTVEIFHDYHNIFNSEGSVDRAVVAEKAELALSNHPQQTLRDTPLPFGYPDVHEHEGQGSQMSSQTNTQPVTHDSFDILEQGGDYYLKPQTGEPLRHGNGVFFNDLSNPVHTSLTSADPIQQDILSGNCQQQPSVLHSSHGTAPSFNTLLDLQSSHDHASAPANSMVQSLKLPQIHPRNTCQENEDFGVGQSHHLWNIPVSHNTFQSGNGLSSLQRHQPYSGQSNVPHNQLSGAFRGFMQGELGFSDRQGPQYFSDKNSQSHHMGTVSVHPHPENYQKYTRSSQPSQAPSIL